MIAHALAAGLTGLALILLAVEPAGAEPDINNGRLIAVGGGSGGPQTACFSCHGVDGVGDGTGAFPRLASQGAFYMYKQLKDYAAESRPNDIMTPIAQALTDAEMEDVAAYYASVDAEYLPPPDADPILLQHGGALAAVGSQEKGVQACVSCHGPGGTGMPPSFPYLAGQYTSYMELQFQLWQGGIRRNDPLDVMADIAMRLSQQDIRAVSLYFETVRPPVRRGAGRLDAPTE